MAAITSTTIFAALVAIANAIVAVFSYILAAHNARNDKKAKKEQKIDNAKQKIEDVCNNGTLSDLIDATKQLGETRK